MCAAAGERDANIAFTFFTMALSSLLIGTSPGPAAAFAERSHERRYLTEVSGFGENASARSSFW